MWNFKTSLLASAALSLPLYMTTEVSAQNEGSVEAPLVGDGSLAPVKSLSKYSANDFGGVPPLPGTRKQLAVGEAPEVYEVEEGDTMFDVCNQLIDDGNYWPKLWSLNPDVKNPHFIYPGMKLAFYSGDLNTPPYLEVVTEDEVVPVDKSEVNEIELVSEEVPTGGDVGRSEVANLQFTKGKQTHELNILAPKEVVGPDGIGADGDPLDGFIFGAKFALADRMQFEVPAFIFDEEKEALATVVGRDDGQNLAGTDAMVYIQGEDGFGDGTYTVLRPSGKVKGFIESGTIGYRYEFIADVRVFGKNSNGLFRGSVFDAVWGVRPGDIVVNFMSTRRAVDRISIVGPVSKASSSVVGFSQFGKSSGGIGDLVFLEKAGLAVGGFYSVFNHEKNREIRHQKLDDIGSDAALVGVVRVVEISGNSALGLIVSSMGEIKMGDVLTR